jgi:Ankyrin repeats (3 copies)
MKSNINPDNKLCQLPLHIAAGNESRKMVEFFIEMGADVNAKDNLGKTALQDPIEANSTEVVELLIAKRARCSRDLEWVAQFNQQETLNWILKSPPDEFKMEHLEVRFKTMKHLEIMFKYLCEFPEANLAELMCGDTFLHVAAREGHLHYMPLIFENQQ